MKMRPKSRLLDVCSTLFVLTTGAAAIFMFIGASWRSDTSRQHASPPVRLSAAERAAAARFPTFRGALPVLASPAAMGGERRTRLAATLTLLKSAGFETVSSARVDRFTRGDSLPSRPMLLCFDGNSASVWQDVDPILARLGLKALLLLQPDQLSLTSPYYVTSSELHRLVASGRWELGLLVTPKIRVRQTRAALNELASGGLDAHAALAFSTAPAPGRLARFASLRSRFRIVLADTSTPRYAVAGDRAGALPRVGLPGPSTTLSDLGRLAPRPPQADAPLRQRAVWRAQGGAPRPMAGVLRLAPKPHTWQASLYAPQTSAAWDNYRLHVRITGLSKGNTASVLLRVAGDRQLSVSISSGRLSVRATNSHATQVLATARLHTASVRTLSATLHGSSLQVESGSAIVRVGVPAGNDQGGVGLGGWRLDDRETLTFEHLRIAPA